MFDRATKLFTDWGFNAQSWQGQRGEYWVLAQAIAIIGFIALPIYRPASLNLSTSERYGMWCIAAVLGFFALTLVVKGLLDLSHSLTPLPHPRDDGQLVRSGIYGFIRHPLYSGLIAAALSWAFYIVSLSHLVATIPLFVFFNAKASLEEIWLLQKYPDYADYRQQVNRLIPWLY